MAHQLGERPCPLAPAIAADLRHRDARVVIEHRQRDAAKEAEGRDVPVQERLRRLARIGLHEAGVRLRQVQAEEVNLLPHPADHRDRLAEVHLSVTRRMRQRHEGLPAPRPAEPHMVLHHRVAAGKAVLVTKALEDPLRRMTLLHR